MSDQPLRGSEVEREHEAAECDPDKLAPMLFAFADHLATEAQGPEGYYLAWAGRVREAALLITTCTKHLQAKLQRAEEHRDGFKRERDKVTRDWRCLEEERKAREGLWRVEHRALLGAEGRIEQAAKDFEEWATEEESRIPGAESEKEAEGHRLAALTAKRCAEHLRGRRG